MTFLKVSAFYREIASVFVQLTASKFKPQWIVQIYGGRHGRLKAVHQQSQMAEATRSISDRRGQRKYYNPEIAQQKTFAGMAFMVPFRYKGNNWIKYYFSKSC